MLFLFGFIPILVSLFSFAIYTAAGGSLTAEIAFPALALFDVLQFPLSFLPRVIGAVIASKVSLNRIGEFLSGDELDAMAVEDDFTIDNAIEVHDASFAWKSDSVTLSNINLRIPRGQLLAIVGEVGCGKSSLLTAILGEMPKLSGRVLKNGERIAYVPQQAWIKNATVKDNILFNEPYNKERFLKAIKCCQLEKDLEILPAGDSTEIGEKGINLSGGQKQRISLARSVYSDAEIYLLDDPLSAVDAHVGKALFNECINGVLRGKTRILVTHQLQYLKKCDLIVIMDKGKIEKIGSYNDLIDLSESFSNLIKKSM